MTTEQLLAELQGVLNDVLAAKGLQAQTVEVDTRLLNGALGIDSLDLAGIVVDMQVSTGADPFENGFREFKTVGELVELFHEAVSAAG